MVSVDKDDMGPAASEEVPACLDVITRDVMRKVAWVVAVGLAGCTSAPKPPSCDRGFKKVDVQAGGVVVYEGFAPGSYMDWTLMSEESEFASLMEAYPDADSWSTTSIPRFEHEVAFVRLYSYQYGGPCAWRGCTDGDETYVTHRCGPGTGEDHEYDVISWVAVPRGTSTTFSWRGPYED